MVSCASCTTNCITPVAEVLDRRFGVRQAIMTTVHAYTSSQQLIDGPSTDFRRGRAGAANMIPASTGAALATTKALPALAGRFDGVALRVPIPVGSVADVVAVTARPVTREEVNDAFREEAASDRYRGILGVADDPVVSADIIGDPRASVVDTGDDPGSGRDPGQGHELVRQRVGVRLPDDPGGVRLTGPYRCGPRPGPALNALKVEEIMATREQRQTGGVTLRSQRKGSVLAGWLSSTDHKVIGHMYLITSFFFFCCAGIMALVMRIQLLGPDENFVSDQQYNELFTMHGAIMLLLFATPLFVGFTNELLPLQIGAPGRGVPAAEHPQLLPVRLRGADLAVQLPGTRRRRVVRLVCLFAADQRDVLARHRGRPVDHGPGAVRVRHHPRRRSTSSPRSSACGRPA